MGDAVISLTIDGSVVTVQSGATVLDAVNRLGIPLSQLCKDPDRPAIGACRTCLVKVEGVRGFPASCHLPAREGMVVSTNDPVLTRIRNGVLDLTCGMATPSFNRPGFGQLSDACARLGFFQRRHMPWRHVPVDDTKSFFVLDRDACILCSRCTVACDDVQQIGAIALLGRSSATKVGVFGDGPLSSSVCTSCGQCVAACPTGAIRPKETPSAVMREVETTCPYCGVGCGIRLRVRPDGRLSLMTDDVPTNRSSRGMLCVKGRFGTGFVHAADRITHPMIRRNGRWDQVSWDEALDVAAEGIARNRGSFGALASAKATNEEGYLVQKFVRAVMGTNNIDHCARLCHSPSVVAMLRSLGSGATSNSYDDYEEAGCLMVVGSDPSSNHPVIAVRLRQAVNRGAKLIVVNPKRIELCDQADLWLRQRPGTDVTLFNAMARVMIDEGLANIEFVRNRTEGFEAWRASLEPYTLSFTEQMTGVPQEQIAQAARWYAKPAFAGSCLMWGMGITQHTNGTANVHALVNLSLVAGQMGFAGAGISPLRGQNNVQGCCDAGCLPAHLPGYQTYTPETLNTFEAIWNVRPPDNAGMALTEMIDGCLDGSIRAMYMVGENPLLTEPDLHHAKRAISNLDCLVVQELFLHETAELAHVFLPTAAFAEKEGTFTNSERRVQRVRKAIDPPGEAKPDWWITSELARRVALSLGVPDSGFGYSLPSEIFDEMARLVPFLGGISHDRLDREGGIQWPCPTSDHPGTRFLHAESFPIGKAKFIPVVQTAEAAELPDHDFPFLLNTGRILYHWHGGTLTRRVQGLLELAPRLEVAINPDDARRLGLHDGSLVRLTSRRGELTAHAQITDAVRAGEVFIPFVKLAESGANILTNSVYDPAAKIPEYKVCAVAIERLNKRRDSPSCFNLEAPADRPLKETDSEMSHTGQGHRYDLQAIARRAMLARGLLPDFSPAVVREISGLTRSAAKPTPSIRDLRRLLWCSIDNDDSRDLDQLTVTEPLGGGAVKILVAVADVDALVHKGSATDAHAQHNTTSVYTEAEIFPMLPLPLSTGLTSLNEDEERLAIVIEMVVNQDGSLGHSDIYRAWVANHAKLTYHSVAAWLDSREPATGRVATVAGLDEQLRIQDRVAQTLRTVRHMHGALSLETIEPRAVFEDGTLTDLRVEGKNRAQELIEDLMIAANRVTARYLETRGLPSLRRILRSPDRWQRIVELAAHLGERLPPEPDAIALEAFLSKRRRIDPVRFPDLSLTVVKLIGRGEYVVEDPDNKTSPGHFGLAVQAYMHSTAPNRRFPDLLTQRLLKAALAEHRVPYSLEDLGALAQHCTEQEDHASKVERRVRKSAAALLLESKIGQQFDAIVTGASRKGTWVRIVRPSAEGKVVQGFEGLDVGDRVRVELLDTNVEQGFIDFARA